MARPSTTASHSSDPSGIVKNTILQCIFRKGEFIIPEISEQTGFSVTTIAKYVAELHEQGLLERTECLQTNKRGRKPILYHVRSEAYYFLGVDIRPFELTLGLMNLQGEMVHIERFPDFRFENTHNKLDEICTLITQFTGQFLLRNRAEIAGANFNIGGRINSLQGTSATVFNFEETREIPLTELLSERLRMPVYIENDTKAMAYGEYAAVVDPTLKNAIYVNVGWGLGLGLIINGEIYYGKDGYSGEFGHISHYNNNIMCQCGKKGCIETEVSGSAICRKLIERIHNHETSVLSQKVWEGEKITIGDIIEATKLGDRLCVELITRTASDLGLLLAGLINLLNPDCIILGGWITKIPSSYFLQPAKQAILKYSLRLLTQHLTILPSMLGSDAGITGACMIARKKAIRDRMLSKE
ncbi:ROK family transcriptional regulator [Alistipes sp.]|uniref:ROK family transcriptional regulator n=1 Tax=Alistipes sp. TaxID=1872444 RepID=UPI0025B89E5A|nr:ROK family protein [Alistipes sp.]